jgi:hypothetical protein
VTAMVSNLTFALGYRTIFAERKRHTRNNNTAVAGGNVSSDRVDADLSG